MRSIFLYTTITSALLLAGASEGRRPFTAEDYYALENAQDPRISLDGRLVAYTVTTLERQQNRRHTEIWLAPTDASRPAWQFTHGEGSNAPRWSPDGKRLAFLSARRDPETGTAQRAQIYTLSLEGGEARRVTEMKSGDLKNGVTDFQWSPDGKRMVCVSRVGASDAASGNKERSDLRNYTHSTYKIDGQGFLDDRWSRLFVVDVATGAARPLTTGSAQNESEPRWSPDGKRIAYVTQRLDSEMIGGAGLFVVSAEGGAPTRISQIDTSIHSVRWSPDGTRLAFIGSTDATNIPKMWIAPSAGGKATFVSNEVTFVTEVEWASEKELIYTAAVRGAHPIFRLDLASGKSIAVASRWFVRNMDLQEHSGLLAFAASDNTHPSEIGVIDTHTGKARSVASLNNKLAQVELQSIESFTYSGAGGLPIEGFLTKPASWQAGKKYPLILMIHGGPNGMWGYQWNHEIQAFAAHGWAVLGLNPRGSSGYGEAFQRAVFKEWGGKAYQDILAGVDAAIERYPWIDGARLGVTGHSYGGFMTDWIVGHTDRFKAACTLAGISDFVSVEGIRDGYYGHTRDFGPNLFDDFELYLNSSPIRHAKNAKTPTLILHGEQDQRVPLSQGEEFFRALQHFKVPSELVILPREGHSLRSEPRHAVALLKWQIYWFERWMEGKLDAVKPE